MVESISAVATWVGALTRGGILRTALEERGVEEALGLIGEARLSELREHFKDASPEVRERERHGAILACVWMANADRDLAETEKELLRTIIASADLPLARAQALSDAISEPPELSSVATDLTQPLLRELMLALAWQLALADGRVEASERSAFDQLASALEVSPERAEEIRDRASLPPA